MRRPWHAEAAHNSFGRGGAPKFSPPPKRMQDPAQARGAPAWTRAADAVIAIARSVINGASDRPVGAAAAYARAKIASYAACAAAVLLLRDPVLLFASMVAAVVVSFREWWYLLLAAAVPMVFYITATHNVLSGDVVSHVVSASAALNIYLTLVFGGVAVIASVPSLQAAMTLDIGGAIGKIGRFAPIVMVLSLKGLVETDALEGVASWAGTLLKFATSVVDSLAPGARFLTGVLHDAAGMAGA